MPRLLFAAFFVLGFCSGVVFVLLIEQWNILKDIGKDIEKSLKKYENRNSF